MTTDKDKDLVFLDCLSHELAMEDSESGAPETLEERRAVDKLMLRARTAIAEAHRFEAEGRHDVGAVGSFRGLPARILRMTREDVLARLAELQRVVGDLLALREPELDAMPLSALQMLLAEAEQASQQTGST